MKKVNFMSTILPRDGAGAGAGSGVGAGAAPLERLQLRLRPIKGGSGRLRLRNTVRNTYALQVYKYLLS